MSWTLVLPWTRRLLAQLIRSSQPATAPGRPTFRLWLEELETRDVLSTYFLAPGGSDTAAGSEASPWQSLRYANTRIVAGDTLVLRQGTYAGNITINVPDITIRSYAGEWATIACPTTDPAAEWVLRFNIDAHRGTLQRLELSGGYYYALKTESNYDLGRVVEYGARNLLVEDCKLHDSGRDVIKLTPGSDDAIFRRCEIYNSGRRDPSNADGIDNVNADRMIVQDCYFHDIATTGALAKGGALGCVIERNRFENIGEIGITLGGYTDPQWFDRGTTTYYENSDGIVRNNIVVNARFAGIALTGARNGQVYNNTLVDVARTAQSGILLNSGDIWVSGVNHITPNENATLVNNIVATAPGSTRPVFQIRANGLVGTLSLANNRYFASGSVALFVDSRTSSLYTGGFPGWRTHIGAEAGSSEGDPGLDARQHLTFTSACIDAGLAISGFANDIDREGRPSGVAWDIGADEITIVRLEDDPLSPGRQALVVHGTAGDDTVLFQARNRGTIVAVQLNGISHGQFQVSALSRLIAYGYDGNDRLIVEGGLQLGAFLSGGAGDDTLQGDNGNDLLLGGAGQDILIGNRGNDLLFAGAGADALYGGRGDDLLIASPTLHDADLTALRQIFQEWTSSRSYATRTSNLRTGANGLPALNASTVIDDGEADTLTGEGDTDWFFGTPPGDLLRDRGSKERIN
jgi:parallel beta-helix repeat protein